MLSSIGSKVKNRASSSSSSSSFFLRLLEVRRAMASGTVVLSKPIEDKNGIQDEEQEEGGEANGGSRGDPEKAPAVAPLCKSAQKRILKMERQRLRKEQKKTEEKERKHKEAERRRNEWVERFAAMPPEEREVLARQKTESRAARKESRSQRKEKMKAAMESGRNLVLDLEFSHLMKPNAVTSLVQQVMYSYAANTKAASPFRLTLTGCQGEILNQLSKFSGFSNWMLHKDEGSYLEAFEERKGDLVYLTADADETLEHLEESKIYIIGGLVDRNRWKGVTYEKAKNQGILTAKLPISEHLKMACSQVLTVNQVVEILLAFLELNDWSQVLNKVVPLRKRAVEGQSDVNIEKREKVSCEIPNKTIELNCDSLNSDENIEMREMLPCEIPKKTIELNN